MSEARRHAPATVRNRDPILSVLRRALPKSGLVVEIASGTGEHIVHFAQGLPDLRWQPSDPDSSARASINEWISEAGVRNVGAPIRIDAAAGEWPIDQADAILCINMIHISPWEATIGLMAGARQLLPPGGLLYLYGPYRQADVPTASSNEGFDQMLKAQDPRWGLRDLDAVVALAGEQGLTQERVIEMPANNLSVLLRKA